MNDSPTTSKEAAVRLILGEMGPLLDRFDAAAKIMKEGHALFEEDMKGLGEFMGRIEAVLQEASESAAALRQLSTRASGSADPVKRLKTPGPASVPIKHLFVCCVAASAMVLGGMLVFNHATIQNARVGSAVLKSLPYLDVESRKKLEAAIHKSND